MYTVFKHSHKSKTQPRIITMRCFKAFDIIEYNKDLMNCNLYDSVSQQLWKYQ